MSKLKSVALRLIYPAIIWVTSTLIAVFFVVKNDGFGQGDIRGFSVLTLNFSIASILLFRIFEKIFKRVNILLAILLTISLTILQAIIFIYTAWLIFGSWLGAFSFPIFPIWIIAIGIGNFYILTISKNKFRLKHLLGIVGAGFFIYALMIFYNTTQNIRAENQNFDIICLSWTSSEKVPIISDLTKWSLTEKEARDIIDLGVKGEFWGERFFRVENSKIISVKNPTLSLEDKQNSILFSFGNDIDTTTTNTRLKVIIIMNHPVEESFTFEQSINKSIIVLQNEKESGFTIFPNNFVSNIKKIKIEKTDFRAFPYWTNLSIELKGRSNFHANGFQWMEK